MSDGPDTASDRPDTPPGVTDPGQPLSPPIHAKGPTEMDRGPQPFPIVGIGASAGGLDPIRRLLGVIRGQPAMAFIVVEHLAPDQESHLRDLLASSTELLVHEAEPGMPVEAGHVYVIPPGVSLAVAQGALHLQPREDVRAPQYTIDFLFRSLAEERQSRAVGVVLSGTGTDGTQGICEIKAVGGITFAQSADTSQFSQMPRSAAEAGCVDFVLPPEEIADRLVAIAGHPYLRPSPGPGEPEPDGDGHYRRALAAVRAVTGVDFGLYRDTTIKRRMLRRMALHGLQQMGDYVARLQSDPHEVDLLYQDLLINVTGFFRDASVFEVLKREVFPQVVKGKSPATPLRIWVPGCSTGQETYSLAIALTEFFDDQPFRPPIQMFATDISDQTLDRARTGFYPESIEAEVSPERLRRFFRREDTGYRVDKSIRDACVFARHNLTSDPPFSHLDLISCRNVLIYLSTLLQRRVLPTFHYALNLPGFLLLGSAETVGDTTDLFEPVDRAAKIYSKRATMVRSPLHLAASDMRTMTRPPGRPHPPATTAADFLREADRALAGRFAPPGVVVNEALEVLQFRGRTGAYLEPPTGEPTTNLLKLAREGLFLELRSALEEAKRAGISVRRTGIRVRRDNNAVDVDIEVLPVRVGGTSENCYVVLFDETPGEATAPPPPPTEPQEIERELVRLQQELQATREYMDSLLEQQDAANEELRTANEEILSSNEELQSTNEELETAKEELQSSNEELITVNEQLQRRNHELSQANDDLTNLLSSTNIPVVMVGGDLRIRRFTPPARKVLNLLPADVGRPITDIRPAILVPDLDPVLTKVIDTVQPFEHEVRDREGHWFLLRIYPYRTGDHRIDGAVVLLLDIDQRKRAEELLRDAGRRKDVFLATLSHELRTPLAPLRHAVDVLRVAPNDDVARSQSLDVLERQVRQLGRIIEDLVDVSRITERKIQLRREAVPLASVIDAAIETCGSFFEAQHQPFTKRIPNEALLLDADPVRAAQVLINLLQNAAKFTPSGGRVELEARRVDQDGAADERGAFVGITVRDSGEGIAPELLPHIFEMFAQGEHALDNPRSGLGIGLAVSRTLAEMHGGSLSARSDGKGLGSSFTVRLPLATARTHRARMATPAPGAAGTDGHRRVLVVDDNTDQANLLATLIRLMGHEVRVAHDGQAAVKVAQEYRPEVAFVDIGLPGVTGYEVAEELRRRPEHGKLLLVALTGWGGDDVRERSQAAGFDRHLVKPTSREDIEEAIGAHRGA